MRKLWIGASFVALCSIVSACGSTASGDSAAVTVNGHDVAMAAYTEAFWGLRVQYSDSIGYDPCSISSLASVCTGLKNQALTKIIDTELVRQYAAAHHISLPKFDLDREWAVIMANRFANRLDVLEADARHTHSTPADIKQGIADDLLQQYVIYDVTRNMSLYARAVRLAVIRAGSVKELKQILTQLKQQPNFLLLAKDLTASPTSQCAKSQRHCGDLGWVPYPFIQPSEKQIEKTLLGGVDGPYANGSEYDIYLVEARDLHYRLSVNQAYTMRSGLLFPKWLKQQEKSAHITKHVQV